MDAASRKEIWSYLTGGYVTSSPAIGSDNTVYVGSYDSTLYALDGTTGQQKWNFTINEYLVGSSPAIGADETIYVGSKSYRLYALGAPLD